MRQYFEINKVDAEQRMVYGYASTEAVDSQGETVTLDAMKGAWTDYMQFANVREMHGNSAVGVVKEHSFDEKGVFIGVKVVDDKAWEKVVEKVYKGFSIGGKKLKDGFDKVTKTITGLKLTEISLVDRPANPEALIEVFKADGHVTGTDPDLEPESTEPVVEVTPVIKSETPEMNWQDPDAITKFLASIPAEAKETIAKALLPAAAPVAQDPSDLRKALKALGATETDDIAKGMYDVSRFADAVQCLVYLQSCATYEASSEGDGSSMPQQLADLVQQAGKVLLEMAQEEIGELVGQMKLPDGSPVVTIMDVIASSAYATDLKKEADLIDVVKAGARNSAADAGRLQKAHDLLAEMGAGCATEKHDHDHDVTKMAGDLEKMAGEMGTLRKAHDTLKASYDALKKAHDKTPVAPKGALLVVEKADDVNPELVKTEIEPVRKVDGSIDEAATEMKKVHSGGGRPFGR
jgi:phage head maturation protease